MRQQDVPSTLLGSDLFALSLGLDMLDVGGFVVAAAIVVVEMTSAGDHREIFVLRRNRQSNPFSPHQKLVYGPLRRNTRGRFAGMSILASNRSASDALYNGGDALRWLRQSSCVRAPFQKKVAIASATAATATATSKEQAQHPEPRTRARTLGITCNRHSTESGVANQEIDLVLNVRSLRSVDEKEMRDVNTRAPLTLCDVAAMVYAPVGAQRIMREQASLLEL